MLYGVVSCIQSFAHNRVRGVFLYGAYILFVNVVYFHLEFYNKRLDIIWSGFVYYSVICSFAHNRVHGVFLYSAYILYVNVVYSNYDCKKN